MNINAESITVNGREYVPADSVQTKELDRDCVIVRARGAGVFIGAIAKREGTEITFKWSRRIWYWKGARECSEMARYGVKQPNECKISPSVRGTIVPEAIEIIPCTIEARDILLGVPDWTA